MRGWIIGLGIIVFVAVLVFAAREASIPRVLPVPADLRGFVRDATFAGRLEGGRYVPAACAYGATAPGLAVWRFSLSDDEASGISTVQLKQLAGPSFAATIQRVEPKGDGAAVIVLDPAPGAVTLVLDVVGDALQIAAEGDLITYGADGRRTLSRQGLEGGLFRRCPDRAG